VCPGVFTGKSSTHAWQGPGRGEVALTALPQGLVGEAQRVLEINHHWPDLAPMAGAAYRVVFADGSSRSGVLDAQGHARLEAIPAGPAELYISEDPRPAAPGAASAHGSGDQALDNEVSQLGMEGIDLHALVMRHAGRLA